MMLWQPGAMPQSTMAVTALLPGQGVQAERVLGEEGDVHHRPAGLQHRLHGLEAHEAGHRAHHQVGPGDRVPHLGRVGQVARRVVTRSSPAIRSRRPGSRSTAVTSKPGSAARSATIACPTSPQPRTTIFIKLSLVVSWRLPAAWLLSDPGCPRGGSSA